MYGNKKMWLRENQKADVVLEHSVLYSAYTVRTEGACMNVLTACMNQLTAC